jgi:peptidoglycan/LPS O-acetylase OafA/YrhL
VSTNAITTPGELQRRDAETAASAPAQPLEERIYYPQLDGMRFFAFALVYLFHNGVPQWNSWFAPWIRELNRRWPSVGAYLPADLAYRFQNNGWVGVQLFFLLSGFLITTLLLREEAKFGRISLKAFWARRILRIWPLYYLTIALTFFALPLFDGASSWIGYREFLGKHLVAFLAFLGNWSMGVRGPVPYDFVSILWSVCVEEQFYLLCPLVIALVGSRWRLVAVLALMAAGIGARYWYATTNASGLLFQYSTLTHLDTLLGGVLLAIVLFHFPPGRLVRAFLTAFEWPVVLVTVWLFCQPGLAHGTVVHKVWDFVSIWFCSVGLVLVAVAGHGLIAKILGYSRLVWLGKISYGLYMYHEIALWLGKRVFERLGWFPNNEIIQTIATFALTVGLAAISYYSYERPFLRLKRVWTRVPSRPV